MALLTYKARDEEGRLQRGTLEAVDEGSLRSRLRDRGLYVVEVKAEIPRAKNISGKVSRHELILFTYHLQAIVSGGVPLLLGLSDLADETRGRRFRAVIEDVRSALESGSSLSMALARHPKVFPESYMRMVEAGETGGRLDECLGRIVHLMEWTEELNGQLKQLVRYPAIVLSAMFGLILLILGFVLPRFRGVLDALNVELPWTTRVLLAASSFVQTRWPFLIVGAIVLGVGLAILLRLPRIKILCDRGLLKIPVVGSLQHSLLASQLAHFLGAFTQTGVPIGSALDLCAGIIGNRFVSLRIAEVRTRVLEGDTLTHAFRQAEILPPLVLRMLAIGEETGALPESLEKAREFYDREIPRRVKELFDLVGPVLTLVLGVLLLFVLLSVLLPVYRIYGAIHGGH